MLRSIKELLGYSIHATDGDLGNIKDFYFEENRWFIRYLILKTGNWLTGREILIARPCFGEKVDAESQKFTLDIDKETIKNSPEVDTRKPVSRKKEQELFEHYHWPVYWAPEEPVASELNSIDKKIYDMEEKFNNTNSINLRSVKEVIGYKINAKDGEIGHVDDVIISDDWGIKHIVVDTGTWLPGQKVLLSVIWANEIVWAGKEIGCPMLTRQQIKESPDYDPGAPVSEEYEKRLYDYYGRAKM